MVHPLSPVCLLRGFGGERCFLTILLNKKISFLRQNRGFFVLQGRDLLPFVEIYDPHGKEEEFTR
jgi:hypothetical protein